MVYTGWEPQTRSAVRETSIAFQATTVIAPRQETDSGFVVADLNLKPIYANDTAFRVLRYSSELPESETWEVTLQTQLRLIFQATGFSVDALPLASFVSGRRCYVCRPFLLNVCEDNTRPPLVALVIDRPLQAQAALLEASRRFHLSPREYQTVVHLMKGLTTKEIAQQMDVSPNTVKQFIRLIMSKMSVTTRSGILGKLLSA